ncbi:hypothetical protein GA0115261_108261, partial [Streptomyces sp. OspMP-M43]
GCGVPPAAASGLVEPAALCVVDGVVLDDRSASLAGHAAARTTEAADRLRTMFRYGWETDEARMRAHVEQCAREAGGDWLNAGARHELVEEVTRRSFLRRGNRWVRRPAVEEIVTVTAVEPDAEVFPSVEVYDRLTCPMTIVLAADGFYASRRDDVRGVVDAVPGRRLIDIDSNHNIPMTRPAELAAIILDLVRDRATASAGNAD